MRERFNRYWIAAADVSHDEPYIVMTCQWWWYCLYNNNKNRYICVCIWFSLTALHQESRVNSHHQAPSPPSGPLYPLGQHPLSLSNTSNSHWPFSSRAERKPWDEPGPPRDSAADPVPSPAVQEHPLLVGLRLCFDWREIQAEDQDWTKGCYYYYYWEEALLATRLECATHSTHKDDSLDSVFSTNLYLCVHKVCVENTGLIVKGPGEIAPPFLMKF